MLKTHESSIRLRLTLNFSVFRYGDVQNPDEACKMARVAFGDASADSDNVAEDSTIQRQMQFIDEVVDVPV